MRRAVAVLVVAFAAVPATASGEITAGPVLAGGGAAWADRTAGGAVRVLTMRPGARPVVARRWARPRDPASDRTISAIAAGARRGAAVVTTCTPVRRSLVDRCAGHAFAGPFSRLRGPRPPERAGRRCDGRANAEEVAIGTGWTAVLASRRCLGRYAGTAAARRRIAARRGGARRTVPVSFTAHGLRLGGRYLAWLDGRGGAVLHDLARDRRVRRVGDAPGSVGALDVQADGTLALIRSGRPNRSCVSVLPIDGPERTLDCWFEGSPTGETAQAGGSGGASPRPPVAMAVGRVLYLREGRELVLRRPAGDPEVLARFPVTLARLGAIDLGPRSAIWAEQPHRVPDAGGMPGMPEPSGPPRVVIRTL